MKKLRGWFATEEAAPPAPAPAAADPAAVDEGIVRDALFGVLDPEIGIDIVTLGLVYHIDVTDDAIHVVYTLTTPGCPLADYMRNAMQQAVAAVAGGRRVELQLVWEPRWSPEHIQGGAW